MLLFVFYRIEHSVPPFQLFVDFHGHSRKKNVFMYGCQENSPDSDVVGVDKPCTSRNDDLGENLSTWDFCSNEPAVKVCVILNITA